MFKIGQIAKLMISLMNKAIYNRNHFAGQMKAIKAKSTEDFNHIRLIPFSNLLKFKIIAMILNKT